MRLKFTFFLLSLSCAFYSASAQNTALLFDGSTTSVTTTQMIVPTTGDFTVEFWALLPTFPAGTGGLAEFISQGQSGGGFYMGTDNINGNFRMGDNWLNTGVPVPLGRWMHLALAYSSASTTATFYIDGVQKATNSTYSISAGSSNTALGIQFGAFGEFMAGSMDELRIWNIARTPTQIKLGMYGTVDPATAGLIAYYTMNEGSGTTMGNSTATTGLNGTLVNTAWVNSPVQFGTNALTFDGSSTGVIVPNSPVFDLTTGTVEAQINPSVLNATNMEIAGNRSGGTTRYSFHVSATQLGMWNGTSFGTVNVAIPTGTWTTVSFVTDGTNTTAYVNGASVGTLLVGGVTPITFGSATGMTFDIGVSKNGAGDAEWFQGSIDEVRVWSTQQTPAQMLADYNFTLVGNEPGLVALYSFDQGIPSGTNSNLITAVDNTSNNNHGTLANFALTGSLSNFTAHSQITLPVNFTSFTATRVDDQVLLKWQTAQEENSRDYSIERSSDGSRYTDIGTVAAAGNSSTATNYSFTDIAPATGLNYYRLKETDLDGKFMYSVVKTVTFPTSAVQQLSWSIIGSKAAQLDLTHGSNEFYTLMDISGRTLAQGQFSSGKLILNQLAGGLYVVKVMTFTGRQMNAKLFIP